MRLNNFAPWRFLTVTLFHLDAFDTMMLWVRFGLSLSIIIFVLVLTAFSAIYPDKLFLGRFDTSSVDIFQGLFDKLSSSVVDDWYTGLNNGLGLTTSEVLVLTKYLESQVHDLPKYVKTSVYGWCTTKYAEEEVWQQDGTWKQIHNSTTETSCRFEGAHYLMNYRDLLNELGLGLVLSFAYGYKYKSGQLIDETPEGKSFEKYIITFSWRKYQLLSVLYAIGVMEVAILVGIFPYYNLKYNPLRQRMSRILLHSLSVLKLLIFALAVVTVVCFTIITLSMRYKISIELDSYGFSYHLGGAWFTFLWLFAFSNIASCLLWSGYEWCITNPSILHDSEETTFMLGVHMIPMQKSSAGSRKNINIEETSYEGNLIRTNSSDTVYSRAEAILPSSAFHF